MNGHRFRRPSPALVISIVALVMAMVGTGYAALNIPANSVGTKQLKGNAVTKAKIHKNAVTTAKVKDHTLTGKDINLKKLGTVPSADVANSLAPLEATHIVGAAGEPPFLSGSKNVPGAPGIAFQPAGFYKDHEGIVHLQGIVEAGSEGPIPGVLFQLPAGYRPPSGITEFFETGVAGESSGFFLYVFGSNVSIGSVSLDGYLLAPEGGAYLSGITFRAGS